MNTSIKIRAATLQDWPAIKDIYCQGIRTGDATFQTEDEIPEGALWFESKMAGLIYVVETDAEIVGWAALSPVSSRCVYAGVSEVSVYVAAVARGHGVGDALMGHLIAESEQAGIWTLQAGIFPENEASISLHQKHGFRIVGVREKLGTLNGVWRDVVLMERRSPKF